MVLQEKIAWSPSFVKEKKFTTPAKISYCKMKGKCFSLKILNTEKISTRLSVLNLRVKNSSYQASSHRPIFLMRMPVLVTQLECYSWVPIIIMIDTFFFGLDHIYFETKMLILLKLWSVSQYWRTRDISTLLVCQHLQFFFFEKAWFPQNETSSENKHMSDHLC